VDLPDVKFAPFHKNHPDVYNALYVYLIYLINNVINDSLVIAEKFTCYNNQK